MPGIPGSKGPDHNQEIPDIHSRFEEKPKIKKLNVSTKASNFFKSLFAAKTPEVRAPSVKELKEQALRVKEQEIILKGERLKSNGLKHLKEGLDLKTEMETRLNEYLKEVNSGVKDQDLIDEINLLKGQIGQISLNINKVNSDLDQSLEGVSKELKEVQDELKQLRIKK